MLDVGDTVPLVATVTDGGGNPADAGTVSLTVTLPDGTSTTPTVTNPPAQTGRYEHPYVITQHGLHRYRFTFTGGVPDQAFADVFNAADPAWPAVVGLAEVRTHLRYPADDTSDDEALRGLILSASRVVEDVVGAVARRTIVETNSGGERHIVLTHRPILEVTTVAVDGDIVDPGDYTVSPAGLLAHRWSRWPAGVHNVETTYVVGRTAVLANVVDATLELIRINWRPQQGGNYSPFDGGPGDDFGAGNIEASLQGQLRLGFFVPNTVVQRLQPDQRAPVVL